MAQYPIARDKRYRIAKEFCGYDRPRFVLRFCGEFIESSQFYIPLVGRAVGHNAMRNGSAPIAEKKP